MTTTHEPRGSGGQQAGLREPRPTEAELDRLLALTRHALTDRLSGVPAGDVLAAYLQRGKMLRARLVFAAASALDGDAEEVLRAAESIELLHAASLFHDDIIDGADRRRGLESLHGALGVGPALVLADDLLLRAFAALAEARVYHPADRVLDAIQALHELASECCRGELEELHAERWVSEAEYIAIVGGKTAAPFAAAGILGAVLVGASPEQQGKIRDYARHLGIAFQIRDDMLDLVGRPEELGKPVGNSLERGRPLLPLLYLWNDGSPAIREELARLEAEEWPREALLQLLARGGVLDRVAEVRERHLTRSIAALDGLPNPGGVAALGELARRATRLPDDLG